MDAADARGAVDEECVARIVSAWTSTHVERPAEEPEPEPEPEATETEQLRADVDFLSAMMGVSL